MDDPDLVYDRTVSPDFLKTFLAGGFAETLMDYAQSRLPIDFQLRKNPKTGEQWGTLYVGMTSVLDVRSLRRGGFRLTAHRKYARDDLGWDPAWSTARSAEECAATWLHVEGYLERIIPEVMTSGRYTSKEGLVQASVSTFTADPSRAVLDREVSPHFRDESTKRLIQTTYGEPLAEAALSVPHVPGSPRTPFGMLCDTLAVDGLGRLLAIEVKPGNVGTLAWVAAQATMYARVLQHWVDVDESWQKTIVGSFEQRRALGLLPADFEMPSLTGEVVPAVAYSRAVSSTYRDRMHSVQDALLASGVGDERLEFYTVSVSGRLDRADRPT